ncbi:Alanine racemase [Kerstersia similis]
MAHNLGVVRQGLQRSVAATGGRMPSIWAVIKANAYGHGIERAVQGFAQADGLAMLDIEEALRCRAAGWQGPLLLLEGFFEPGDLAVLARHGISAAVHHSEQLAMLAHTPLPAPVNVFIKLNSGMNRLGFSPVQYAAAWQQAQQLRLQGRIASVGRMTHFAQADGAAGVASQMQVFDQVTGAYDGPVSVCNSAAALRYPALATRPDGFQHWVRPGICLYGSSPFADQSAAELGLRPAMTLMARLIAVRDLMPGDEVGYSALFRAEQPMRIGVVACGYADGYPRIAATGTPVTVAGVPARVLGRVSMDMLAVDLTPVPHAGVGAPVVLWGEGGPSVDAVAAAGNTLGYELICALAARVPQVVEG